MTEDADTIMFVLCSDVGRVGVPQKADIHPGKVFTKRFDLDHVAEAYDAMDKREAIKSLLVISD